MEKDSVGGRIKFLRIAQGSSLPKLAEKASVSKGYLSQLETGAASSPSAEVLYRIATALNTTIGKLMGEAPGNAQVRPIPRDIPSHLQEFVSELRKSGEEIDQEDVLMLASIRFRGKKPENREDWRFIYQAIKRSTTKE